VRRRGSHVLQIFGSQMVASLSAPRTGRPLPPVRFLVLISVRGSVDPRAIGLGLGQLKNPVISSGIEPATLRLVAFCLNQLRYRVPPYLNGMCLIKQIYNFTFVSANRERRNMDYTSSEWMNM
jgi:hypothetical protein